MEPLVTSLRPEQRQAAVALWEAAGLTRPWNDAFADLDRALRGPDSDVLAITEDGAVLATAMVGHDGHRGWVYYVAVAPAARRRGLGRVLMRAAEAWLQARDIPKILLMVRAGNRAAEAFYAALGYTADDVVVLGRRLDERSP